MRSLVSPLIPFPNIAWWQIAFSVGHVSWELSERFEKMSFRNRYEIATPNGLLQLSIPIQGGRTHKARMADIRISSDTDWQRQHFRTLISAYGNAPYFEHYLPSLQPLFEQPFELLASFNRATFSWVKNVLDISLDEEFSETYTPTYPPSTIDFRKQKKFPLLHDKAYYQVFQDRVGFLSNLSILDLIFCEGPQSVSLLEGRS
ncbi:MAG: WbqC family protein [Bacteroidetes bacterium]|nr:WbqC family protein [Bacteroidota bacterium]MBS1740863.1 WbqC family protein [Bacteroidota bacterium]